MKRDPTPEESNRMGNIAFCAMFAPLVILAAIGWLTEPTKEPWEEIMRKKDLDKKRKER